MGTAPSRDSHVNIEQHAFYSVPQADASWVVASGVRWYDSLPARFHMKPDIKPTTFMKISSKIQEGNYII